jgi:hypothetical protein
MQKVWEEDELGDTISERDGNMWKLVDALIARVINEGDVRIGDANTTTI